MRKELAFPDTSLDDLRVFSEPFRQEIGYQLDRTQRRLNLYGWKPFSIIGPGMREIRTRDADGIYRVMYITKFEEAVYVLHYFQKKAQITNQSDIGLGRRCYKELAQEWKDEN